MIRQIRDDNPAVIFLETDMKIEIIRTKVDSWYFRIVARNGRIICHSEIYNALASAKKTATKFKLPIKELDMRDDK